MDQKAVNAATDALVNATRTSAVNTGNISEANTQVLAPGLAIGSNAPGGYNYQRTIAPTIEPLARSIVVSSKQELLKAVIKDAVWGARNRLQDAQLGMRARQRKFQADQAERNRQRQREAEERARRQERMYAQAIQANNNRRLATSTPSGRVVSKAAPTGGGRVYNPQAQSYNPQSARINLQGGSAWQGGTLRVQ